MNYKESATKLNEFNDFMDCIKFQLALKECGRKASEITLRDFIIAISKVFKPLTIDVAGVTFKDMVEKDWILPKGEAVIHDSQRVEMPFSIHRFKRTTKQMQIELDKIKNKPINFNQL